MQSKELENYIEFLLVWSLLRFGMPARVALRKLRCADCAVMPIIESAFTVYPLYLQNNPDSPCHRLCGRKPYPYTRH